MHLSFHNPPSATLVQSHAEDAPCAALRCVVFTVPLGNQNASWRRMTPLLLGNPLSPRPHASGDRRGIFTSGDVSIPAQGHLRARHVVRASASMPRACCLRWPSFPAQRPLPHSPHNLFLPDVKVQLCPCSSSDSSKSSAATATCHRPPV